ncbi:hypothetical protein [Okeania sp. SIO2B9]|uniref:hypothetical protein n=1 Tax=Okeania sp. SIO2B9 TaxID=2607782 RepID=UPI00257985FA|nr:hypothetical protein [Okeania sp. SIO2B9]
MACAQKSFSRGRRQPTPRPSPSQEGNTGDRSQNSGGTGNYRGGRKKSYPKIVLS